MKRNQGKLQLNIDDYRLGVNVTGDVYSFAVCGVGDKLRLMLYEAGQERPRFVYTITSEYKIGDVFSFKIVGAELDGLRYLYEDKNGIFTDPYAARLDNVPEFGKPRNNIPGVIERNDYNWREDRSPRIPKSDMIMYKLHVRGFTRSETSAVKNPGTFAAVTAKIPYFTKLGINVIELMPAYEFNEGSSVPNYWGYTKDAFYLAPKAAYSASYLDGDGDYTVEFKDMVRKLHKAGIEVVMEMFFDGVSDAMVIVNIIRFWMHNYHIDGVHLICDDRLKVMIAGDPYIRDLKLIYTDWSGYEGRNLYACNDGFKDVVRPFLKGDDGQVPLYLEAMKKNPAGVGQINYICTNNGFTLMDLVSYDHKHNESNGENGSDGTDYNMSWNCGVEGPTKKRAIVKLRNRQMANAMLLLLLSQGIPLIYSGDEFGNSQLGNNNAYNQDNELGYTDWNALKRNRAYATFVKELIAFRKSHKMLHQKLQAVMTDYKYHGMPDMSFHGFRAWYPDREFYSKQAGILLCGKYADEDCDIYIAINMHWEEHLLALPSVAESKWKVAFSSDGEKKLDIIEGKGINVGPRTMMVLLSG